MCVVIAFPSDVTACRGRSATFSCYVQFTNGTPSAATWLQNGQTDVSGLNAHVLFDNSSDSFSPTVINNTLLITNVSSVESGSTYSCHQGNIESESDPASLTIAG